MLTDADVAAAVKLAGPRDVVQLVSYVTTRAAFELGRNVALTPGDVVYSSSAIIDPATGRSAVAAGAARVVDLLPAALLQGRAH